VPFQRFSSAFENGRLVAFDVDLHEIRRTVFLAEERVDCGNFDVERCGPSGDERGAVQCTLTLPSPMGRGFSDRFQRSRVSQTSALGNMQRE
jgi:hypothetical protein